MLLLLLFSVCNRFPSTCNPSWGCSLLVVDNGVVFQFVEHLFDSWDSDNHWWDHYWWDNYRRDSISYLLIEIPIPFATVHFPQPLSGYLESLRPPNIFSGYFGIFPSAQISFQDIFGIFPSARISFQDFLESFRPPIKSFQDISGIFPSAPRFFQDILGQFQTSFPG